MTPALRVIASVAGLAVITFVGYRILRDRTDPVTPPPPDAVAPDFRMIDADGPARLRWTTTTERGDQSDLVVIIADGLEVRIEGALRRYLVDGAPFLCYSAGDDTVCEVDPDPSPLVPTAGKLTFAAEDAVASTFAGRAASCWTFEDGPIAGRSCADDDTGVAVLTETTDRDTGSTYLQTLVEWGPASADDVAMPPEIEAMVR
ncbi:MAG: hypothetical protein R2707_19180 [Acidimicrobiales bacterium]